MNERSGLITMKGNPLTLVGEEVKVGVEAPDFTVLDNELNPVTLDSAKGKVSIILSVPSLDTPICEVETKRFNEEAAALGPEIKILVISMDLPFAQKRWCAAEGVDKLRTLSDHREASFGLAYGVLIKELRLLARAVFVIDREGKIGYIQLVEEVGREPDYEEVLNAVRDIL